jgi:hypothetical protein
MRKEPPLKLPAQTHAGKLLRQVPQNGPIQSRRLIFSGAFRIPVGQRVAGGPCLPHSQKTRFHTIVFRLAPPQNNFAGKGQSANAGRRRPAFPRESRTRVFENLNGSN